MNSAELRAKLAEQRARRVSHPVVTKRRRPDFGTVLGVIATLVFSALTIFYLWAFERLPASSAPDAATLHAIAPTNIATRMPPPSPTSTPYILRVCAGLPEARLHVRFTPGGEVRGYLVEGEIVRVNRQDDGWSEIASPITGWVNASYLCK